MIELFTRYVPWDVIRELFVGEYGIITLGLRYAVGIILPIVATFFLFFSILEDTGYFPRLALLVDRLFKKIGLTGRAVIPIVLGFGCDTMATMVTRTLESVRERIIATILLALAIPCSAQLGVILALLSNTPGALLVWSICLLLIFLFIGFLAARVVPGETPMFYMELPPMRLPQLSNVLTKTYTRMQWYFMEILPLFILASVLLWLGKITNFFSTMVTWMKPAMAALGLPQEAAVAFIFGFFRRDYGAAGLYDLQTDGLLNPRQLVVAAVTLTLFIPCVAQFLVMKRERGLKVAMAIGIFVTVVAFGSGWLLNKFLLVTGIL
jgi:ferrous iron transport protein B